MSYQFSPFSKDVSTGEDVVLTYLQRGLWLTPLEALALIDSDDKGIRGGCRIASLMEIREAGGDGKEGEDYQAGNTCSVFFLSCPIDKS